MLKEKRELFLLKDVKTWRSEGIAPFILHLGARWR